MDHRIPRNEIEGTTDVLFDGLSKIILVLVSGNLAEVTGEEIHGLLPTFRVSFLRNLTSLSNEAFCFHDLPQVTGISASKHLYCFSASKTSPVGIWDTA